MNLEDKIEQAKKDALNVLENNTENKKEAIIQAIEILADAKYGDAINKYKELEEECKADKNLCEKLGLRVLNNEEKKFYNAVAVDVATAITTKQIDAIPTSIVDVSLEYVRNNSKILQSGLITLLPADVKKWITAEKTGTFSWSGLTEGIKTQLKGKIKGFNVELAKLSVFLVIPKAIKDLSLPFVDKFFTEVLGETLNEGVENGYLVGNGKDAPIGIYKKDAVDEDGTHKDKTLNTNVTNFTPKGLAPVKKHLTNQGKRDIEKIFLICNPNDEADYVAPALYDALGNMISSYKNLEVITSSQNPQGKAAFTIPGKYQMGFSGFVINEYDQTLALDDANLVIAKVYANGKGVDDTIAYVFDVTKLEEYIPVVKTITEAKVTSMPEKTETNSESESQETPGA